jgi:hypothetical protein
LRARYSSDTSKMAEISENDLDGNKSEEDDDELAEEID